MQPRPAQQKHVDALSGAPVPVEPDQEPTVIDEILERVVLLVLSWDERVISLPGLVGKEEEVRPTFVSNPRKAVQRLAEKAHAQHCGSRRRRGPARHVGYVRRTQSQAEGIRGQPVPSGAHRH